MAGDAAKPHARASETHGATACAPIRRGVQGAHEAAHVALFYADPDQFLDGVMRFLEPAIQAGGPIAVAVLQPRAKLLQARLHRQGGDLEFLDVRELGRNPARIIPAVYTLLERHGGRLLHYVGELVWPGRSRAEIQEVARHESLTNLAWPGAAIRMLCPYDTAALAPSVLLDAERTHPWLIADGGTIPSGRYRGSSFPAGVDDPLPEVPRDAATAMFELHDLRRIRTLVGDYALGAGLSASCVADLVLAVNEVATNAIKHARAPGRVYVWATAKSVVCQLEDPGHIADPLAGRHRPVASADGGIGLWMVNQLCDLVEVRTAATGTTIRLHAGLS